MGRVSAHISTSIGRVHLYPHMWAECTCTHILGLVAVQVSIACHPQPALLPRAAPVPRDLQLTTEATALTQRHLVNTYATLGWLIRSVNDNIACGFLCLIGVYSSCLATLQQMDKVSL